MRINYTPTSIQHLSIRSKRLVENLSTASSSQAQPKKERTINFIPFQIHPILTDGIVYKSATSPSAWKREHKRGANVLRPGRSKNHPCEMSFGRHSSGQHGSGNINNIKRFAFVLFPPSCSFFLQHTCTHAHTQPAIEARGFLVFGGAGAKVFHQHVCINYKID